MKGMSEPLIKKCEHLIRETLALASVNPKSVSQIHLIGGSSRIPKYQNLIKSIFTDENKIINYTEPDEIISRGCASIAKDVIEIGVEDYALALDSVKAYTGVQICTKDFGYMQKGAFCVAIPKNTPVPCRRKVVLTRAKGEKSFSLHACSKSKDETKELMTLKLDDLEGEGESSITVTFTLEKGKLLVSVVDKVSGAHVENKHDVHA